MNPSICINLTLIPIRMDSNQIRLQHTTSFIYCKQIHIDIYIHVLCLPGVQVHSFKIQNFIHQRAWRKSFPMTSVWRHQDSEMPLSAADELIHTECSSLKWRRLRPEVKSKGCLILDACIASTPSCSDRRKGGLNTIVLGHEAFKTWWNLAVLRFMM